MLRRTYGFGVHSPFAFRFITEVIHQPYAYYSYEYLNSALERLIFRTTVDLQPHRVAIYGPHEWATAVKAASRKIIISPRRPDLIVAKADVLTGKSRADITARVGEGASLLATDCNAAFEAEIKKVLRGGMTFSNGRGTVIVVDKGLPRQDFELFF